MCAERWVKLQLYALKDNSHLDVEIGHRQGVCLYEVAARLDEIAHQGREDLLGAVGVAHPHLQERERIGAESSLPALLGSDLAEALVAVRVVALAAGLHDGID